MQYTDIDAPQHDKNGPAVGLPPDDGTFLSELDLAGSGLAPSQEPRGMPSRGQKSSRTDRV